MRSKTAPAPVNTLRNNNSPFLHKNGVFSISQVIREPGIFDPGMNRSQNTRIAVIARASEKPMTRGEANQALRLLTLWVTRAAKRISRERNVASGDRSSAVKSNGYRRRNRKK